MSSIRNRRGFTLVEALVVVAILGVLAVMATTSGSRSSSRARQAQAKALLAGIYSAEKVFFAEYNVYTPYMSDLNFFSDNGFYDLYYNVGFVKQGGPPLSDDVTAANGVDTNLRINSPTATSLAGAELNLGVLQDPYCPPGRCNYVQAGNAAQPPAIVDVCPGAPCRVSNTTFRALAAGYIQLPTVADLWTMDEQKNLTNDQDGTIGGP